MKLVINHVTARPFLVPRPGSNDDPLITVIAHVYRMSLDDFLVKSSQLPRPGRPGFFARLLRPARELGVRVKLTTPKGRTMNVVCGFKKGQFANTFDLIFPRGTDAGDVVKGSTVEIERFDWVA